MCDGFRGGVVGGVRCHRRAAGTCLRASHCDLPDVGKGWWQVQGACVSPSWAPRGHGVVGGAAAGLTLNVSVCLTDGGALVSHAQHRGRRLMLRV